MLRAVGLSATTAAASAALSPNSAYHFHGYAGNQKNGDAAFYDISGMLDHGVFGTNLSTTQAWTDTPYVATINPAGGATDSVICLPPVNFDYSSETLIVWWNGIVTPEGSAADFMGDGISATYPGWKIRCNTNGTMQMVLYDATHNGGVFGGSSAVAPFDGTQHSLAFLLDGTTKTYGYWVDEVFDTAFGASYATFSSGTVVDTKNSNTVNLGCAVPKVAASTAGIATLTSGWVVFRLPTGYALPSPAAMTNVFKALRANTSRPILGSAF